ncbi:CHAT domain-containing protein [Pseudanabaena biceps]|nr:CHAT domain-containing protein [Pseudanabaena biceps]
MLRSFVLTSLSFLLAIPCFSAVWILPVESYPEQDEVRGGSSPLLNPLFILNLIFTLSQSSSSSQPREDLSPEIAEIRGQISRLYFLLARQYALQNQLPEACNALEKAHSSELEAYLRRDLPAKQSDSKDCYASDLQRISQLTGSPTALVYATTSQGGLELIMVPPSGDRTKYLTKQNLKQLSEPAIANPVRKITGNATTKDVDIVISDFRNSLRDDASEDFMPYARQLYDWVIRPIEADLDRNQIKSIVFVMNGNLRVVPPAAFHDGKHFLVEKYAVTTIPNWQLTEPKRTDRTLNPQVLAMGLSESSGGWAALPATKVEVEAISLQVLTGKAFMNSEFTIDNLRSQLDKQKYGIVHLATHAKFLDQSPSQSFIQFWGDRLQMDRISKLNLVTDMLTLSACETAVGQNLGLAGLAASSGAKSVLASLWTVSDAGTAPLMIRFYSGLATAPSKAIALQQAQLALLRGNVQIKNDQIKGIEGIVGIPFSFNANNIDLKHPYYWSSFTLVGNWL